MVKSVSLQTELFCIANETTADGFAGAPLSAANLLIM